MDIWNDVSLDPIETVAVPPRHDSLDRYFRQRVPVVLDQFTDRWECGKRWDLDYIASKVNKVQVSRPSNDGIYRYYKFERIPFSEFVTTLSTTKDLYMGLDPLYRANAEPNYPEDLRELANDLDVPFFIDKQDLSSVNLWIGPGGNKSLLHFDPWSSLIVMLEGRKRFVLFDSKETAKMYSYSIFDFGSFKDKMLDSRVNPLEIDSAKYPNFLKAKGIEGVVEKGQALFVPGGFWHYIESEGLNIAVNFFWNSSGSLSRLRRPLLDYRIKKSTFDAVSKSIRFIRTYIIPKRRPAAAGD